MIVKTDSIAVQCTHCGLPVPAGLIEPDREAQFCCNGCAGAYELIHGNGLDSFYRMAETKASDGSAFRKPSVARFDDFDEPAFQEKYAKADSTSSKTANEHQANDSGELEIELAVEGIHCGACVWLLEKLPVILPGIVSARVNWAKRTIVVRWCNKQVQLSQIAATLNQLGYAPSPVLLNEHQNRWKVENRKHLIRIGIAAACAGNNMIISLALYLGMFSHMSIGMTHLLRVASCVVGLAALHWPGRTFLQSAWGAIRTKTPHMDLPIALGLLVGTLAGLANVIRGTGEIYFDSLSILIFLLLIGRWIQFRQQAIAANSIELLFQLTPQRTIKLVDGQPFETLVDLVQIGDLLQIRAGDLFPVDGEIVEGKSRVDESILTGESNAIEKLSGDLVAAGTLNLDSKILMKAMAIGHETRLSQIINLVEQASLDRPQMVLWANKIGGYFVSAVIVLALFTLGWWSSVNLEVAINRTIALLIVACPCALALATPLTIAVAIGRAAKQKIMVKGGDVLQSLQNPGMIWLDKTGTLTDGDLKVERWLGDTSWIDIVSALEEEFSHPVAKAIAQHRKTTWHVFDKIRQENHVKIDYAVIESRTAVLESQDHPGLGVSGVVGRHDVVIGNEKLLAKFDIVPASRQLRISNRLIEQGFSPCWIGVDGRIVALVAIGDSIRAEAKSAVHHLKDKGWNIGILSGDHQQVVDRVAKRILIEPANAIGGVDPESKLQTIKNSMSRGNVVMVGDGVNDSAALAAATVGIAVKNGAEASLAAAPVYLAQAGLNPILKLLSLSDSTSRTMRINLGVSLAYNLTFAALAFAGFINPLVAAILMPISSITVVALSLNSGRISPDQNFEPITKARS